MQKGQGLPLSFIVIAAISALVLILVIAFTIGGLGGFFRQIISPAPEDLSVVQSACRSFCDQLVTVSTATQFRGSTYCTKTYAVDLNDDGSISTSNPQEAGLHCYSAFSPDAPSLAAINVECTLQTTGGQVLSAGQNGAPGNCTVTSP